MIPAKKCAHCGRIPLLRQTGNPSTNTPSYLKLACPSGTCPNSLGTATLVGSFNRRSLSLANQNALQVCIINWNIKQEEIEKAATLNIETLKLAIRRISNV